MKISIIAAIGRNRELGEENKLIWKIPADLARLKEKTMGHAIVMGRKTFDSIGRALPGRLNVVLTRSGAGFQASENCIFVPNLEEAVKKAEEWEVNHNRENPEVLIFGGAQIFEQMIGQANKLYLTKINSEAPLADSFFPDYSEFKKVVFSEKHMDDSLEYEFVDLEK